MPYLPLPLRSDREEVFFAAGYCFPTVVRIVTTVGKLALMIREHWFRLFGDVLFDNNPSRTTELIRGLRGRGEPEKLNAWR